MKATTGGMAMQATTPTPIAAAERKPALILLAEARNFARLSEMLEPQRVLELASEFFSLAARGVIQHGGEVFTVHNDTLLGVFRHAGAAQLVERAAKAARTIQVEFAALAESWRESFGLRTAVAMALHLGETVFGSSGPHGRERLVAFGDSVTIADQLLQRARAGEYVLSDAAMTALAGSDLDLDVQPLPPLELARRSPIKIFGVLLDTRLDFT